MIENTLGSLAGLMGFVLVATAMLRPMIPFRLPPGVLALAIGEGATFSADRPDGYLA